MATAPNAPQGGRLTATVWTRPLQVTVAVCSLVFTVGTVLQNFLIIDLDMLDHALRLAGADATEAAQRAPGFLTGLRTVGWVYIVGNALGMLALLGRNWTFWVVMAVNLTKAAGVVVIPQAVFDASSALYGPAGVLPSLLTDGGAALLSLVLLGSLAIFRASWRRIVT